MWLILVTILTILIYIYKEKRENKAFWKFISEIPGPKPRPLIGNLTDIFTDSENNFLSRRKWATEFYPIYKFSSLNFAVVSIVNPYDAEKVLTSPKNVEKGAAYNCLKSWLRTGLLTSSAAKWRERRKLLTPAFHFSILKEFINIFNTETSNLVQEILEKVNEPYIDVSKHITQFSLYAIMEAAVGVKLKENKLRESYSDALFKMGQAVVYRLNRPWLLLKPLYSITQASKDEKYAVDILHNFSNNVIKERKKTFRLNDSCSSSSTNGRKAVDILLSAQAAGEDINDEGIQEEVDTFLFAGHDTSGTTICFTLMLLANEKDVQERIVQEIYEVLGDSDPNHRDLQELRYTERCIKEVMRLYPAIPMVNRIVGEDIKTHSGYTIPKGTNVNIYIYDIHRSPDIWENPEKFDPDRFLPENIAQRHPFAYIPFSAGNRNCLGQKFAMLEIKAALCGVLRKFKLEPIDTPQSIKYKMDIVLRPCNKIRVKCIPRN